MANFEKALEKIKALREAKGKEKQTFAEIDKCLKAAKKAKQWKVLVKLYWEASLNWQHIVMNEDAKENPVMKKRNLGIKNMVKTAKAAEGVINKHQVDELKGTSYRFLGRCYFYTTEHNKSLREYRKAIKYLRKFEPKKILEINAFIPEPLILLGKTERGIKHAIKAFDAFDNTQTGKKLKKEDYVTWAIWKSGIFPRVSKALVQAGAQFDKKLLNLYLDKSFKILEKPEGKITWGHDLFEYRMDEIKSSRSVLKRLAVFVLAFASSFVHR